MVSALSAARTFGCWLQRRGLESNTIDEQLIEQYFQQNAVPLHRGSSRTVLHRLLCLLREVGACPPAKMPAKSPDQILVEDFQQYLFKERGLADRTVEHYTEAAVAFLSGCREAQRDRAALTAADVLTFVRHCALCRKPMHIQQLCCGLRSFLRYLRFRGDIQNDLAGCVPRIAHWRLATLPNFLTRAQIKRVLTHCNRRTRVGRRDYAVMLLLARLGLRAHEIRCLMLDDIDWRNGHLTIPSKGTGPQQMPLPPDVGAALAAYLTDGRPVSRSRAVFVRLPPPHTQLACPRSVLSIAARALDASGVKAPRKGTHVFRHSLATQMLKGGASLREIGQILRHRDEDTTLIYAKVDLTRLRSLAMPWPGGAR